MMNKTSPTSETSKFHSFDRTDHVYATVVGHELWTSVFIPKLARQGQQNSSSGRPDHVPVLVFWHGGGFIVGDRLYEPWWPVWLLELVLSQNAMIVAPDYRLMPEACGADILDDMDAFWTWFQRSLLDVAETEAWTVRPDIGRVLCAGQSAGGSVALYSALTRSDVSIQALVSLYGPLHGDIPDVKHARPRMLVGSWPPSPREAEAKIRAYMRQTKGAIRTTGDPAEMWELFASLVQQGRLPRLFHRKPDPRLDTLNLLKENKTLPPFWMVHGQDDSMISPRCSIEFSKQMDELVPDVPKVLSVVPGEHSFDVSLTMKEPWIADGCEFLLKYW